MVRLDGSAVMLKSGGKTTTTRDTERAMLLLVALTLTRYRPVGVPGSVCMVRRDVLFRPMLLLTRDGTGAWRIVEFEVARLVERVAVPVRPWNDVAFSAKLTESP